MNLFLKMLVAAGLCAACGSGNIPDLSPAEFASAVEKDSLAVVIDARTPEEYAEGHLKGAVLMNIKDIPSFDEKARGLNPSGHYYIYCRSGRRSLVAAERLHKDSLQVFNMKGGIIAWQNAGLPVTKD